MVNNNNERLAKGNYDFRKEFIEMSRMIALIISSMIVITGASTAYGAEYTDVGPAHWAYEAVNAMSEQSIITGYPNGSFLPDNTITYGEFIKMALIAGTGEDAGNAASGHWAQNYYSKALEQGYFTEYDIERSMLGEKIARAHMALIISSILGDVEIDDYDEIQKGITDITFKTNYEYDITKSYASGILTGYADRTFRPDKTLSRAESAAVIHRLVDESKRILPGGDEVPLTGKVKDMVKNFDSFVNSGNGTIDEDLAAAETYTIERDAAKYNMSLHENRGTKWIEIENPSGLGWLYLMKDGRIVEFMQATPNADGSIGAIYRNNITQIDFIASVTNNKSILLIFNPFKK